MKWKDLLFFEKDPKLPISKSETEMSCFSNLRSDEGTLLLPYQHWRLNSFLENRKAMFTPGGEATP